MDPVKLKAIREWSPPVNVKAIQSFLGFCNFYWKFIPSFSNITHPLLDLTKQSNPWTRGPDQETTFCNLQTTLQPCGYLSQTFSLAEQNYDIFNQELLAMIHGLKEWKQYLLGSPFPVEVLTDHKNLTHFKEPQRLSHRQAWWLLFLQDFDMIY